VEQIFGNLVNNAVAYLDKNRPGEISIGTLESSAAEDAGRVTYFVRDNGMGIPAHLHGKLFVAFQRLHGNASPGEGIGLALVRRVLDRNGGRIWVESTAGAGSTFFVALPAVAAAVHNADAVTGTAPAAEPALNP
jgi:signal transduction histidine kinase